MTLAKEDEEKIRKQLSELFEGMMHTLFKQEGASFNIEILADKPVQDFIEAHASVLDGSFKQVEMSDAMRRRLTRSDYVFSGMKTFHELNQAFPSLLDENGNRKTFEEFLKDVQKIDSTYNRDYLRAEYNFVQSSATMAAKWEGFMEDGDRYYLQYRTAGDDKVRPEHAALNGVTLPIDDSFWSEYYPPNGWNCRCNVVQVRKSKQPPTPHDEAMALGEEALQRDTKGMFRFNAGKEQKTVPDYNPYTIRRCKDCDIAKGKLNLVFIPENEVCTACKLLRTIQPILKEKISKNKQLFEELRQNPDYKDVQFNEKTGGLKAFHKGHNLDKKKGWYELAVQNAGFIKGHSVILGDEPQDKYKEKSSEGLWDNMPFEIGGAENATSNNVRNALKHCAKKPNVRVAVIFFPQAPFNINEFYKGLARFNGLKGSPQYKEFDVIYCIQKDKIVHIKKPSN